MNAQRPRQVGSSSSFINSDTNENEPLLDASALACEKTSCISSANSLPIFSRIKAQQCGVQRVVNAQTGFKFHGVNAFFPKHAPGLHLPGFAGGPLQPAKYWYQGL